MKKDTLTNTIVPKRIATLTDSGIIAELQTFPNQAIIWGILDEMNKKLVWQLPGGKAVMLMEDNYNDPFIFVAGILDLSDVEAIIKLCPSGFPMVYCNPIYHHLFLEKGWDFNLRIQLAYVTPIIQSSHEKWCIKPIDNMSLFQQCLGFEETSKRYASSEQFLRYGKGYVLCQGTQIISEAYIDYLGGNHAEIGVITHPDYRGQGAATQIASYLVEECKAKQIIPIWSCQVNNRASLKTAIKVGFCIERYYVQMVPEVGNTFSPRLEEWIQNNPPESRDW